MKNELGNMIVVMFVALSLFFAFTTNNGVKPSEAGEYYGEMINDLTE